MRTKLTNDGTEPFQHPPFPGFNDRPPFICELYVSKAGCEVIKDENFEEILKEVKFRGRIKKVVELYAQCVKKISQREPTPDVVICCIPQKIIAECTVRITSSGYSQRIRKSVGERKALKEIRTKGGFLFSEMDPTVRLVGVHNDIHRGIKAETMQYNIPTQLIKPQTLNLIEDPKKLGVQDPATRAWNLAVGLYYKGGGIPWRMAHVEPDICFVGISFYKEVLTNDPLMHTSMAQTFTTKGDGYVLKGAPFRWDKNESKDRSPHLDRQSACELINSVLEFYKEQNEGILPRKLVVHKTSRFENDELAGFKDASNKIPRRDFVALGYRKIQFYRKGNYPPLRGTYVKFTDKNMLLYTEGFIPYLRTYPGPKVPKPIEILEHHGDSPWNEILREILMLTKMNWNSADFACKQPITIAFARNVGEILAELPPDRPIQHEYRFYM